MRVLDQQQVEIGTHVITFNRIAPPVLPAPTPTPAPTPQSQAQTRAAPVARTATRSPGTRSQGRTNARSARTSDATGNQEKPYKMLSVSATVYDHQFSELRRYGGNAPELRVYVNMDFNLFAGVTSIETADTVYMLIFGLGNDTADSLTQAGQPFPTSRSSRPTPRPTRSSKATPTTTPRTWRHWRRCAPTTTPTRRSLPPPIGKGWPTKPRTTNG